MYSLIVFLLALGQLLVIGASYATQSFNLFNMLLVDGSPFYLAMTLFRPESVFMDQSPLYMMMLGYHLTKYFIFFLSQVKDERGFLQIAAVMMEAVYLSLSAYYLN